MNDEDESLVEFLVTVQAQLRVRDTDLESALKQAESKLEDNDHIGTYCFTGIWVDE